jgi:hypothetical protein
VPAFAGTTGKINHQLYLRRLRAGGPEASNGHATAVAVGEPGSPRGGE